MSFYRGPDRCGFDFGLSSEQEGVGKQHSIRPLPAPGMKAVSQFGCISALTLLLAPGCLARGRWISLRAGGFELYTNGSEKAGLQTLERLERIQRVFGALAGTRRIQPLPVRVFLFRSLKDYQPFQPAASTTAYFQSGPQRDYIVMHAVTGETMRVACHEYVHLALAHSAARLPQWLEEGMAEFYSTLEVGQSAIRAGYPIPAHLFVLRRTEWLDGAQLLSITSKSPYYNEISRTGIFYAESWALVHMLTLAQPYRGSFRRLLALLGQGTPQESALKQVFGKGIDALLAELRRYLPSRRLPYLEQPQQDPAAMGRPATTSLTSADADLATVDLLVQIGRLEEAARRLQSASESMPGTPAIETRLGIIAMRRRHYVEARQHLDWAISGGSRDAATYFECAVLARETGKSREDVLEKLHRAVELNPNYAEAHYLLAVSLTEDGRPLEAIPHLETAVRILPRQSSFWQALSLACARVDRLEDARHAARMALNAAQTLYEVKMAQAAISLADAAGEGQKASPGAAPAAERRVLGRLEQIDCLGTSARLHVLTAAGRLAFLVRKPGEILMGNASSLTFRFHCGPQQNVAIALEYTSLPDAATRTAGEVTTITFPASVPASTR